VSSSVGAIVLAAGASSRLGQPKQLLMYRGESLLERAIRLANEAGVAPVLTIVGANRELILSSVNFGNSMLVINEQWAQGISTSIHAGLDALDANARHASGVLIMACDQPRLAADHLRMLVNRFALQAEPSIVASAYAQVLGIPAVFPRKVFAALYALQGDKGARALLVDPPCPLISVPFAGGEVDIDSPDDLSALQ
jgi:molybdenum cofactor cytidylyltransferase